MFSNLGSGEVIIVGLLILIFFGSKKLNDLARGLGESSKEIEKIKSRLDPSKEGLMAEEDSNKKEVKTA